jgi:hypothetical protein
MSHMGVASLVTNYNWSIHETSKKVALVSGWKHLGTSQTFHEIFRLIQRKVRNCEEILILGLGVWWLVPYFCVDASCTPL